MMDVTCSELNVGRLGSSTIEQDQRLQFANGLLALVQSYFKIPRFIFSFRIASVQESAATMVMQRVL